MAQTKSRSTSSSARKPAAKRSSSSSGSTNGKARSSGRTGKSRSTTANGKSRSSSTNGKSRSSGTTKSSTTRSTPTRSSSSRSRNGSNSVLDKAKGPLVAGAAGVAGLVGGAVIGAKRASNGSGTVKVLGAAAKEIGKAGYSVGQLAGEVRKVREKIK